MVENKCNIVVLGAGVTGLTTALQLAEDPSVTVTVVAKHMPGDWDIEYASPFAGANVLPMAEGHDSTWERRTWPVLKRLAESVPAAGIHFQNTRVYRRCQDPGPGAKAGGGLGPLFVHDPWYRSLLPGFGELDAAEIPAGYDSGCEFTSVCINVQLYLPWLASECLRRGVVLRRGSAAHVLDARRLSGWSAAAGIVVNATGLGSLGLGGVQDQRVKPARGITVLVRDELRDGTMVTAASEEGSPAEVTYVMMRPGGGGTVLGGTYEIGTRDADFEPALVDRIMARAAAVCPALGGGRDLSVVRVAAGLRPYREGGVRLEREWVTRDGEGGEGGEGSQAGPEGCWVVHNYGHAGWGYQGSYGCADRVVELVGEIRNV